MTFLTIFGNCISPILGMAIPVFIEEIKKRNKKREFKGVIDFESLFYKLLEKAKKDLKRYFPEIDFSIDEKKLKDSFKYNLNYEANNKGLIDLYDKTLISNFADILIKNGAVTVTDEQSGEEDIKQKVRNLLRTTITYFNAELFIDFPELYIFNDEQIIKSILEEIKKIVGDFKLKFLDKTIQIIFSKTNNLSRFKLTLSENLKYYIERKYTEEIISCVNGLESGIILLHGEPGSGKTAIMANFVKEMGFPPHYFFGKEQGKKIIDAKSDISNMTIDYLELDITDTNPTNRYDKLLELQNDYDKKLIIIIDGIDETDENIFQLLPQNNNYNKKIVYLISAKTNSVNCDLVKSKIDSKHIIELKTKNDESETKTKEYLEKRFKEDEALIKIVNDMNFQEKQNIENFKRVLIEKGNGNFTYVSFVLDSISHGIELPVELPKELNEFYEIIYNKLDDEINCEYFGQILSLYSIFYLPMSKESIEILLDSDKFDDYKFKKVFDKVKWLFTEYKENENSKYTLFHNSFKEYITQKSDENTQESHRKIIEYYRKERTFINEEIDEYTYKYLMEHIYEYSLIPQSDLKILDDSIDKYLGETEEKKPENYLDLGKNRILSALCYINMMLNKYKDKQKYTDLKIKVLNILEKNLDIPASKYSTINIMRSLIDKGDYINALKIIFVDKSFQLTGKLDVFWGLRVIIKENFNLSTKDIYCSKNFYFLCIEKLIERSFDQNKKLTNETKNIIDLLPNNYWKANLYVFISKCWFKNNNLNETNNNLEKAEDIALKIYDYKYRSEIMLEIVKCYIKLNKNDKAKSFLEKAEEFIFRVDNLWKRSKKILELVNNYIELNERDKAKLLLEKAEELTLKIDDSWKRNEEILEIINGYIELSMREEAILFLEKVEEFTFKFDDLRERSKKILELINGYIELNERDKAKLLLEKAERLTLKIGNLRERNMYILKIADAYIELGKRNEITSFLEKAEELALKIDNSWNRNEEILRIAKIYIELSKRKEAISFLKKAEEHILKIDDPWKRNEELLKIINVYIRLNEKNKAKLLLKKAEELTLKIDDSGERNMNILKMIDAYVELSKRNETTSFLEKAEDLTLKIDNSWERNMAILRIANVYIELSKREEALPFLEKAEDLTLKIDNSRKRNMDILKVANAYIEINENDKVKLLLKKAEELTLKSDDPRKRNMDMLKITNAYIKVNENDKAKLLLKKAKELTLKIDNSWKRNEGLLEIANTYIETNENDKAKLIFEKVEELTLKSDDPRKRNMLILRMADVYIELNKNDKAKLLLKKAEELTLKIDDSKERNMDILRIANDYIELNEKNKAKLLLKKAEALTLKINDSWGRNMVILEIVNAYIELSKREEALPFLEKAEKLALKIYDLKKRNMAILRIANAYIEINENDKAKLLLKKAKKLTLKIDDSFERNEAILRIANVYIELNENDKVKLLFEKVEKLALKIDGSRKRNMAILRISNAYVELSKSDETTSLLEKAEELALKINDSRKRNMIISRIVNAYVELNKSDETTSLLKKAEELALKIDGSLFRSKEMLEIAKAYNYADSAKTKDSIKSVINIIHESNFNNEILDIIDNAKELENNNLFKACKDKIEQITNKIFSLSNTVELNRSINEKIALLKYAFCFRPDRRDIINNILISIKNDLLILPLYETTNYILLLSKVVSE